MGLASTTTRGRAVDCESGARIQPSFAAGITKRFAEVFATRDGEVLRLRAAVRVRGSGTRVAVGLPDRWR